MFHLHSIRTKQRFLIAWSIFSLFVLWFLVTMSGTRMYYVGFGIETFAVITPWNMRQMARGTIITGDELAKIKQRVADSKFVEDKYDGADVDTRFMGTNNGITEILIDIKGNFKMGNKSGRLSEKDKQAVSDLIVQTLMKHKAVQL